MNASDKKPCYPSGWRGNTLLEVMIALVILSLGILTVGQLQRLTMFQTRDVFQRTQALDLASRTLERLRTHRSRITSDQINPDQINPRRAVGSVSFERIRTGLDCGTQAPFCIDIQVGPPLFHGDLKPVQVVVSWRGHTGKTHQVTLSTMISRFNEFEPRIPKYAVPADITHGTANVTQ
ncbi:type IV pilus modification PilV family protein [Vibrio rhizosphaerae]|uniref:type IV pilus modification PilV family protein n=1 Tax=Vibrio rhizosphaerae TaxID=398736 RepID=UPI0012F71044|nr:prepilin-type N-terminal cleavage/methylation domain-containing protein [Vibrio rhizosphaerae]